MYNINADESWVTDLECVFKTGDEASPRGMKVKEVLAYKSVVDMNRPILMNDQRKLGYKFMAAEAAWIISGRDDVATIAPYSKEISKFSDNGVNFYGAYGPRFRQQLNYVLACLEKDPDSRQSFASIWRTNPEPSKDIPCTTSLQWLIRDNKLHCVATMRSSDLWLGHPYDIFNFSAMSFYILLILKDYREFHGQGELELGLLYLTAGSKHIYEKNFEGVNEILHDATHLNGIYPGQKKACFDIGAYTDCEQFVDALWYAARSNHGALALIDV